MRIIQSFCQIPKSFFILLVIRYQIKKKRRIMEKSNSYIKNKSKRKKCIQANPHLCNKKNLHIAEFHTTICRPKLLKSL